MSIKNTNRGASPPPTLPPFDTDRPAQIARVAIGAILDGSPPNGANPDEMGGFGECYREMAHAHGRGGTEAARTVFATYAKRDPALAALRAGDPTPAKRVWTAAELLAAQFPDPKWAVPGLVPTGLTLLAGRPKLGKSWLALQFAMAVATGGAALGRNVGEGRVLYLALEDGPRRIQNRLRLQHSTPTGQIDFRFEWPPLAGPGSAELFTEVDQGGYALVVVDTISRALGRADQMKLEDMNVTLGALQRFAVDRDFALLLVDHHRKNGGGAGDVIDDVMGSTSKAAVADAAIGLYRERGKKGATLKVTGRDLEELELALDWDAQLHAWQATGTAAGVRADTVQGEILLALDEFGGEATAPELARFLGKLANHVTRELQELMAKGVVARGDKRGKTVPYRKV